MLLLEKAWGIFKICIFDSCLTMSSNEVFFFLNSPHSKLKQSKRRIFQKEDLFSQSLPSNIPDIPTHKHVRHHFRHQHQAVPDFLISLLISVVKNLMSMPQIHALTRKLSNIYIHLFFWENIYIHINTLTSFFTKI